MQYLREGSRRGRAQYLREGSVAAFLALAVELGALVDPAALLPCALPAADHDACAEQFVTEFGRAAWRRPLVPAEVDDLLANYEGVDMLAGTQETVIDLLASPNMWTLSHAGTPHPELPELVVLDDWSLATRLAYFLWNSTPDPVLLDHAAAGDLGDPAGLVAEAEGLLADPRAERMVGDMYTAMLRVEQLEQVTKDPLVFPQFGAPLAESMKQEVRLFAGEAVLGQDQGNLESLLDGSFTYVDDQLAMLYGDDVISTDGPPGPGSFVRAELDPARRAGLLALPAVMTQHSREAELGFTFRGLTIRQNFLCMVLPPPPPDSGEVPFPDPPYDRYDYWKTIMEPACIGCHQLSDPISFGFDHYDALGQWQDQINGFPVDPSGEVVGVSGVADTTFSGREELTAVLRGTNELPECMVTQHLHFALRRPVAEADQCVVDDLTEQLQQSEGNLSDLLIGIVTSETFRVVRDDEQ